MQIVIIKWIDASYSSSGTWTKDEVHKSFGLLECNTVGYLVEEKPDCYVLAAENQIEAGNFRHIMAIPKSGVKSIRRIRSG